jgi:alkanesulfonate monooxygenase SsuD/methylene tetrahydromethanopterin reductase-like flavin-dependent oxidoreductase (luciferase family)
LKFGVALSRLHPRFHLEATLEAERLGFESVWMADHLVFPVEASGSPHPGDESPAALGRAARYEGWYGLVHDAGSAAERVETLRRLRAEAGRAAEPFEITLSAGADTEAQIDALAVAGVDRLVVSPWRRSRDFAEGLRRFAARFLPNADRG